MATLFQFRKSRRTLGLAQVIAYSVFAVSLSAEGASVQPSPPRTASATLHISVTVVPVIQTPARVVSSPLSEGITYSLEMPPMIETYEIRNLPPGQQNARAKRPAVLRTRVIVPR